MIIRRLTYIARIFRRPDMGDGSDLGGAPSPAPAPEATPAASAPEASPPAAAPAGPATMLEAMSAAIDPKPQDGQAGQPRDELGRFAAAAKEPIPAQPGAAPAPAPAAPGAQPPAVPPQAGQEDPDAMPEGLSPKAQERFQKLANERKELAERLEQAEPQLQQLAYVKDTFKENNIQPEQFDTAVAFIGAINRGDIQTATTILQEQMQALSLITGQPLTADPLAAHPDLRQAVDTLQMSEQYAYEVARARAAQQASQAQQQRLQQHQSAQQAQQREVETQQTQARTAQMEVDTFCKQMMASDIDYAKVEPLLLEAINDGLLRGVPPQQWPHIVKTQYALIKKVAGNQRTVEPATPTLRPTFTPAPGAKPNSMFEAMFGPKS